MNGMARLASAIGTAIELSRKGRAAKRGQYQNGCVTIDARTYPCKLATDITVANGDWVWAQVTDNDSTAIIVGA